MEKPGIYSAGKSLIERICKENNIKWVPLTWDNKLPIISALKNLKTLKNTAFNLQKTNEFDLVHCRSHIPAMVGIKLKKSFGVEFIFDMRGFWADERVDGKLWDLTSPIYRKIYKHTKKKERQACQEAKSIISLTHEGKKVFDRRGFRYSKP